MGMLMEIRSRKKEKFRMGNTVETQEEAETIEEIIEEMIMEMKEEAESIEIEEATMKKEVIEVITEVTEVITREEKEDPIPDRKDQLTAKMMKVSMLFKTRRPRGEYRGNRGGDRGDFQRGGEGRGYYRGRGRGGDGEGSGRGDRGRGGRGRGERPPRK